MNIGRLETSFNHPGLYWWGGEIAWRHKHDWGYHWVLSWGCRPEWRCQVDRHMDELEAKHEAELAEQLEKDREDRQWERT